MTKKCTPLPPRENPGYAYGHNHCSWKSLHWCSLQICTVTVNTNMCFVTLWNKDAITASIALAKNYQTDYKNSETVGKRKTINWVLLAWCGISRSTPLFIHALVVDKVDYCSRYCLVCLVICWTGCSRSSTLSLSEAFQAHRPASLRHWLVVGPVCLTWHTAAAKW